ncbi:LysR family transcriptional regulator [Moritella sp. F3]|uniref:LysR family transcriptional regulator n=1 Tax=Moritella sp. F3 TaxID=2718882 RepID=UPI0018E0ED41|nr:LysR family transcriptional regulator [Moritella sp. F3]GIC78729.1 LysR family transcriptional regulator [Moritella sp. F1]GIC82668.1 LysR family transcriptional regulator [Moritella sp. F3]
MNIQDLTLFVRTAQTCNITASALQLDMSPAAASAALKRLEKQLGVQLFIRSTRKLRITAEGERYLLHCTEALAALEKGKASLNQMQGKIAGDIRLSTSSDLGRNIVLPWLDEVMDIYPELSIQLNVGDSLADFFHDKVDMALRYGEPEDSSLVAFLIAKIDRVVCASPAYLAQHGEPKHPSELTQHNCLLYRFAERAYDTWPFADNAGKYAVKVSGNRLSNDADVVHRWVVAGKGITMKSRLDMAADLRKGNVVELLSDFTSPPISLWLICPNRTQVSPAMLMLRDLLRSKCEAELG